MWNCCWSSVHTVPGVNYKTSLQNASLELFFFFFANFPSQRHKKTYFLTLNHHSTLYYSYILTISATKTRVVCCTGLCTETVSEIANSGRFFFFLLYINLTVVYLNIFYTVKYRTYSSSVWLPLTGMVYDGVLL